MDALGQGVTRGAWTQCVHKAQTQDAGVEQGTCTGHNLHVPWMSVHIPHTSRFA